MDKRVVVDTETGEIVYAVVEVRKKYYSGGFFMGIQEGFLHIAKLGLTGEQYKVMMLVFAKLDFENWLRISQTEIAEELEMQKPHVSRAMKVLVEKGIIHKGPKVGSMLTYRLDPSFGMKGRAKNEKAIRKDIAKLASERGLRLVTNSGQVELDWNKAVKRLEGQSGLSNNVLGGTPQGGAEDETESIE